MFGSGRSFGRCQYAKDPLSFAERPARDSVSLLPKINQSGRSRVRSVLVLRPSVAREQSSPSNSDRRLIRALFEKQLAKIGTVVLGLTEQLR